jgi:hypothetical protein
MQLVVIGGIAMYGDPAMMQSYSGGIGERIAVCGTVKMLAASDKTFAETERVLEQALQQQGRKLAPLAECGQ